MRAANNGISAGIDAYGRILARLGLNVRGVIDVGLPAAVAADAVCAPWAIGYFSCFGVGSRCSRHLGRRASAEIVRIAVICGYRICDGVPEVDALHVCTYQLCS